MAQTKQDSRHDTKPEPKSAPRTDATPAYQSGFGNQFSTEAMPGALPEGRNCPQRAAVRALCRADLGHRLHGRPPREPPHLDLPHPALGGAQALCAHRQRR